MSSYKKTFSLIYSAAIVLIQVLINLAALAFSQITFAQSSFVCVVRADLVGALLVFIVVQYCLYMLGRLVAGKTHFIHKALFYGYFAMILFDILLRPEIFGLC